MTNRAVPLIHCEHIEKRFGYRRVLRDVSFSVAAGEVLSLLGANGSGKTTLLRIIASLDRPDKGEVWLGPVPLSTASHEIRRYVGVVAHAPLLYDRLTGAENLRFFARLYDLEEPQRRIEQLLRTLDLWRWRDSSVRTYSRGMSQRLAIARALLHDPPVVIFDEPDTGLDRESLKQMTELIGQLRERDRAVLITTHSMERAAAWGDRVVELHAGRLHQLEGPDRIGQ
ncbi:MAG: heme ABC exporter ATP-binding protein CcmA [Caldilineaceae bacterium SB0665_bin_25]|nr:heme ABC exporter ATP-binding protein CcmA [Caldilineaceae bacterium SB0665_bin_25]